MHPGQDVGAGDKDRSRRRRLLRDVMADRPHPEQGFRTCLGVLALVKTYGPERVDAACQRGVTIRARTVTSIRSILKTGLDRAFLEGPEEASPLQHANIRSGGYYL